MKKNIILISLLLCAFMKIFAFSKSNEIMLQGTIQYYGNEPFTQAAFVSQEGKLYSFSVFEGLDFTVEDITKNQGYLIEITGILNKDSKSVNFNSEGNIQVTNFSVKK